MDPSISAVATQLGLTVLQVLALMANAQFPAPSSGYGMTAGWSAGSINTFAALFSSALSNGWKISTALLPTANIALMASTTPGPYYSPRLVDPLFDDFP